MRRDQPIGQLRPQPFVLEVVADERHRRRGGRDFVHLEAVVVARAVGVLPRPWLHDRHVVAARAQPASQLVRAPAGAAAVGREGVGGEEDSHDCRLTIADCRSTKSRRFRISRETRRPVCAQCACQLYSRSARARAATPRRWRRSRVAQRGQRVGERGGRGRVVEHAFDLVAHERPQPRQGRRHHGQTRRHVLEDLQRRPVEAQAPAADAARRRTAPRRCRQPPAPPACRSCATAPVKITLSSPRADCLHAPRARARRRSTPPARR